MSFIGLIPAGAFKTIRSAYQTSTNASSLVAGASRLLADSQESRRSAAGLEGELAMSTSRLLTLKGEIASSPNLTPVINKVREESFLTSPLHVSSFHKGPVVLRSRALILQPCTFPQPVWRGRTKSLSRVTHKWHLSNLWLWDISGELSEHPLPEDHGY